MITEESFHVTFDESNPKPVEVKVVDYACIQEKKNLEENQEPNQEKTKK